MAEEIVMTPENKPLLDALIRLVALGRDPDAEDMLVEAIQELVAKRAEVAAMRPIVKAMATMPPTATGWDGSPAFCPWCEGPNDFGADDIAHRAECPVMKARALIEKEGQ